MKAATAIGIVIAFVSLLMGAMMEGTSPMAFFAPSALIIVVGGIAGACTASLGMGAMKSIPTLYKVAVAAPEQELPKQIDLLVAFADTARRDGLLALEGRLGELEDDEFTRKGIQLVVDGSDPELVREILELEVESMRTRHKEGEELFRLASGFAPTMGIIGTVMGLVHVLANLSAPSTLGPSISAAFIATLMGVGSANVIFLPVATRLKQLSLEEAQARFMTIEGILSVQAGDNPRVVGDKLIAFVPPKHRDEVSTVGSPKLTAVDGGQKKAA